MKIKTIGIGLVLLTVLASFWSQPVALAAVTGSNGAVDLAHSNGLTNSLIKTSRTNATVNEIQLDSQSDISTPTINGISPSSGGLGTSVTITGTNFSGFNLWIYFNGYNVDYCTFINSTTIIASVPDLGRSDINSIALTLGCQNGKSAPNTSFNYVASQVQPPTLEGIDVSQATPGTGIVITGRNFVPGFTSVKFNNLESTNVLVVNSTNLIAVLPDLGLNNINGVTVTVSTSWGSATTLADYFTYITTPTITNISPSSGGLGSKVVITGTNFIPGYIWVNFNNVSGEGVSVSSPTTLNVTIPDLGISDIAGIAVTVNDAGGNSSAYQSFNYIASQAQLPVITNIETSESGQGASIYIQGSNFMQGATSVNFGDISSTNVTVLNSNLLSATVPNLGSNNLNGVAVTATTIGGTSLPCTTYNYIAPPIITNLSPAGGGVGSIITIQGENFESKGMAVSFNGITSSQPITFVNSTTLKVNVPDLGINDNSYVSVAVTSLGGSGTTNGFNYVVSQAQPPTNYYVSQARASAGSTIIIEGTNFVSGGTTVKFNNIISGSVSVQSDNCLTTIVPDLGRNNISNVLITVTTIGGTSAGNNSFSYTGNRIATSMFVSSSFSANRQSLTLVAVVTPYPDGGTVQFQENGVNLGNSIGLDNSGQATTTISNLSSGFHTLVAVYTGDDVFAPDSCLVAITVPPSWDINGDGVCDVRDLGLAAAHMGQTGPPGWIPEDVNQDGVIDIRDLGAVAVHIGQSW